MEKEDILKAAASFAQEYAVDVNEEIGSEVVHLKMIHLSNFGPKSLNPLQLLQDIVSLKLPTLFPNVCIGLRIFLCMPASVASAERSFSKLKLVKNFLRTTTLQERLVDLARLSIETDLTRSCDFNDIISSFAQRKARKPICHWVKLRTINVKLVLFPLKQSIIICR